MQNATAAKTEKPSEVIKTERFVLVDGKGLNVLVLIFTQRNGQQWASFNGKNAGNPSRDWHHAHHNMTAARAEFRSLLAKGFTRSAELEAFANS